MGPVGLEGVAVGRSFAFVVAGTVALGVIREAVGASTWTTAFFPGGFRCRVFGLFRGLRICL